MFPLRRIPFTFVSKRFLSNNDSNPSCDPSGKAENLAPSKISADVQAVINEQINAELSAAYTYLAISYYFAKSTVGLMGFSKFYQAMSAEEIEHGNKLARYLLARNGSVDLHTVKKPAHCSWGNIGTTLNETIRLESCVSECLSQLYRTAEKHHDLVTTDFIVGEFLKEQIESIRDVNLLIAKWRTLEKAPDGAYLLDRELQRKHQN
ncbi:soma ferritin-like [Wyeomyia smithii]|uniref:soma ferritin-like n=1 Tax=Wyeomyia smithii TaxID=174621 RepID=UPI0024682264|nr:soma ferritin-like [Wyeomyia smithii]